MPGPVQRVQLDLTEERLDRLRELMVICNITTQKELFNNALSLFEWAVRQRQNNRVIASVDEAQEHYKELSMPALEAIRPSKPVQSTSAM